MFLPPTPSSKQTLYDIILQCSDCKQDLANGNVSSLYPNGYRYTIEGEDCLRGYFEDTTYIFHVNGKSETKTNLRSYCFYND